ncbi:hypothetical protein DF146_30335 [Burkholderia cenocepacia]|nr:hypothetical protein [Burkholderia sp. 9777_1386]MBJ9692459.1 hypothetical protein [Burkholderia cenocepacia]MBR7945107.1 hypothetical protein [Burkholderia cenocepacia]MBR8351441.1 hypothetical protein [Burkholderia cenocepacia]MBR8477840.1 hypothetical protein [Burkholderia cenocepacia]
MRKHVVSFDSAQEVELKSVTFFKAGTEVTGEDILRMEVKRARHMMALLMDKLGADGMVKVFAKEIAAHEANERDWSRRANGRFRSSVAEAHVAAGDGAAFIKWFWDGYRGPNSAAMLRAHPEHLGALSLPGERVGILEVPGHTQFPALLKFRHLDDWSGVPIELAPDMPHRMMGRIESIDGETVGYLLHQFRDTSPGFDARLEIFWPSTAPDDLIRGHADHLMVEWYNWFELYALTRTQPDDLMPLAFSVNA